MTHRKPGTLARSGHVGRNGQARVAALLAMSGLALLAVLGAAAAPAVAGPDAGRPGLLGNGMEYSGDGVHYGVGLPELFDDAPKLVPGEFVERTFWLRNGNAMAVDVSVLAPAPAHGVVVDVRTAAEDFLAMEPGASASVHVAARLPATAGNGSQGRQLEVVLRVLVTESRAGTPASPSTPVNPGDPAGLGDQPGPGELGETGAAIGMWPLAAATLAGGAAALTFRRRTPPAGTAGDNSCEEGRQ